MAEKRMFAKNVVNSDTFLNLDNNAKALYYALCMEADDDGFNNRVRATMAMNKCNDDDITTLVEADLIYIFPSGRIVVLDWRLNNCIQKDRYHPSNFPERKLIITADDKRYQILDKESLSDGEESLSELCEEENKVGLVEKNEGDIIEAENAAGSAVVSAKDFQSFCQTNRYQFTYQMYEAIKHFPNWKEEAKRLYDQNDKK